MLNTIYRYSLRRILLFVLAIGLLLPLTNMYAAPPQQPTADPFQQIAYLWSDNAADFDNFGSVVAIDGKTLVVGAPTKHDPNTGNLNAGAVFIYEQQTNGSWLQTALLYGENTGDQFGFSVAVAGQTVVVGAPYADHDSNAIINGGAAYVYAKQTDGSWQQTALLQPSNPDSDDYFGYSVAVAGTTAVVSAFREGGLNNTLPLSGAVYVYAKQTDGSWPLTTYLKADNAEEGDRFGFKVAMSGVTLVASAYYEDDENNTRSHAGAVYVFTKQADGSWPQTARLRAPYPDTDDRFGYSVAVAGGTLVVGSPYDDGLNNEYIDTGAAFVYVQQSDDSWLYTAPLRADNPDTDDFFAWSVAVDRKTVAVGAISEDDVDNLVESTGAAYIYKQQADQSWSKTMILRATNADEGDYFGHAVAVSGLIAVVGAPREDSVDNTLVNSGAAYLFLGPNTPPIADAGPEQHVAPNSTVFLAGSASDDDGDGLVYKWRQIDGLLVTLNTNTSLTPSFIAPSEPTVLVFELAVTDVHGDTTTSTVKIIVEQDPTMVFLPMIRR